MATATSDAGERWAGRGRLAGIAAVLREVARRQKGAAGLVIVGGMALLAIFPSVFAPYNPYAQNIVDRLQGPSSAHWLGTDELGRDLLSRVIFGTRIALEVSIPAVGAALLAGLVLGVAAGYAGGTLDSVLIVLMDSLQAFPAVILALALLSLLGPSLRNVIIVIAVAFTPNYARVSRAMVLAAKENQWVEAERSLGAGVGRVVLVHILPNIIAPLVILMAMDIPSHDATSSAVRPVRRATSRTTASGAVRCPAAAARRAARGRPGAARRRRGRGRRSGGTSGPGCAWSRPRVRRPAAARWPAARAGGPARG